MDLKSLVSKKFVYVNKNSKISEAVSKMEKNKIPIIPVFERKDLIGFVSLKKLEERYYPPHTKVDKILETPLVLKEEKSLNEIAQMLLEANIEGFVYIENGFRGIVSEVDVVKTCKSLKEISEKDVEDIMSVPVVIEQDEDIGKVRTLMREQNISKIPVVDENGRLSGIVTSLDMMKTIRLSEKIGSGDVKGYYQAKYDIPVSAIMNKNPFTMKKGSVRDVVELMGKYDSSYVVVTLNDGPVGIITAKDILELVASKKEEGVFVQISGLKNIDSFTREKVNDLIERTVQKIGRVYKGIEYLVVHIKEHQKTGSQIKYSIRTRFMTPVGLYVSKSDGWNLIEAVDQAMEKLERIVIEDHKKRKEKNKPKGP